MKSKTNIKKESDIIIEKNITKYKDLIIYENIIDKDNKKNPKNIQPKLTKPCKKINLYEMEDWNITDIKKMLKGISKNGK